MNKRYGFLFVATFALSGSAHGYHYDVFRYLDESFSQLENDMSSWFANDFPRYRKKVQESVKSNVGELTKKIDTNLDDLAKKIEEQSDKLKKQSAELLTKLKDASTRSEHHVRHLHNEANAVFAALKKSGSWLDRMIGRLTKTEKTRHMFDLPGKFSATEKEEAGAYKLEISLPSFGRDDIKLAVQDDNHRVVVTAEKDDSSTVQANGGWRYQSESYFSSQTVNNRTKKIEYKDGKLQVTVDLPDNVDAKNFNSTIDQEKAVITFQLKVADQAQITQK
ncbi:Hsp20/alpha crystallin family protein [Candidatus Babeliales bacterium]|nr:Hsp20/alpha crystallin family protein [Candidatus Babeliales bacterium]